MAQPLQQKPRLDDSRQPLPERWAYVKQARGHHPTRRAHQLTEEEVRQVRAMFQSEAVLYTIAAHFSIPRAEVGKVAKRPFRLRAEVPAAFETETQADMRRRWFRDEVNAAHAEAWALQVDRDWTEAKRENKRRAKATRAEQ